MTTGERTSGSRWLVLGVLTLIYGVNFLDRQILSILAEPIKKDLNLSDGELGLLGGFMFAIFYTTFGIPVAWLADRVNRVKVIAVACTLWSVFCAACGLANSFSQLALARIGVGVGEAGGAPPSYSLLADYFPPRERGMAMGVYSFGVPIGITAGSALGAWIASEHGWRVAFMAVGAPGVALALIALIFVRERPRGGMDTPGVVASTAPVEKIPLFAAVAQFFRTPVLALAALASGASAFVSYGILNWQPPLLIRDKGMTLTEVAQWYSLAAGASMAVGLFLGGFIADRWARRDQRAYARIPAMAFMVAAPVFVLGVQADGWRNALPLLMVPAALSAAWLAPMIAIVQNNAPASCRTVSAALLLFVMNLIGMGGGPYFVGALSDHFKPQYGAEALQMAMLGLTPFMGLAIVCLLFLSRALKNKPV